MRKSKRKPRASRVKSEKWHAEKRALERFGFTLTKRDHEDVASQVRKGEAHFVRRSSARRVYDVLVRGVPSRVVLNSRTKSLVTLYPLDDGL